MIVTHAYVRDIMTADVVTVRPAPSSCAATSNAERVWVDVFSKTRAMLRPASRRPRNPIRFSMRGLEPRSTR